MIAADSLAPLMHGEEDGEEDYEAAAVDEGRRTHPQDACAREDEDCGDCGQAETDAGSHEAESNATWCDPGGRSAETRRVKGSCDCDSRNGTLWNVQPNRLITTA